MRGRLPAVGFRDQTVLGVREGTGAAAGPFVQPVILTGGRLDEEADRAVRS